MRILDRYILKSFLVNYLLALGVMLGMYVLLDLIVNVQDFARGATPGPGSGAGMAAGVAPSAWDIASDMFDYYFYQLPVIFQQVSGIIPTLAAGFTMVRMTRHHELTAMLSSGVSLYRVAAPIILVSIALAALHVINQEFIISRPFIIEKLLRKHDEVNQAALHNEPLLFIKNSDGSLLSAREYDPVKRKMTDVFIVYRSPTGTPISHTYAPQALWEVPPGKATEAWVLSGPDRSKASVIAEDDTGGQGATRRPAFTAPMVVLTTQLTPEQIELILSKKAVDYLSSSRVRDLALFSPEVNRPLLYKIMHLRFTQPLMNIVMLLIGIPFLLTREPNRLIINMFYCTAVSGVIFVATFVIFQMGGTQLDPLLAAWLPVLVFGPFALVMMDTIQT